MEPEPANPSAQANWIDIVIRPTNARIDTLDHEQVKCIADIKEDRYVDLHSVVLSGNSYGKPIFKKLGEILEEAVNFDVINRTIVEIGH